MLKKYQHISILILLTLVFISVFYGKVLVAPNSYVFSNKGDGLKNYYTFAHYIKNNQSNIEFEGMNYPYGENFMYTDCHPLQAYVFKQINHIFPHLSNYSVGILNEFMLASFLITAIFLYLIFVRLNINKNIAIIGAIGITILSPQVFRFIGHWALSYSFAIPMIIYLLLLIDEKFSVKRFLLLIISMLFLFFTHAYLGIIAALMIFTYTGISFLTSVFKKNQQLIIKYIKIGFTAIIPLILFYSFVKLTDHHSNRTTNPWGVYTHHAELNTVFLPTEGPLNSIKDTFFELQPKDQIWEGRAYLGVVAILAMFIFFITILMKKRFVSNDDISSKINTEKVAFLTKLLISALLIFMFSAFIPFRELWFELVEKLSVIKQFRAIGRFAWVLFFVANIVAIFLIDKIYVFIQKQSKVKWVKYIVLCLPFVIILEGLPYHKRYSKIIAQTPNFFDLHQTPQSFQSDCQSIDKEKYQAIIALPFFHIGSDNFVKDGTNNIYKWSFLFSYHLNYPMFNSYLTRTSICESKNIMQLLSSSYYSKAIEKDLKNEKPFLILYSNEELTENGRNLLSISSKLIERDEYSLYEIDKALLFRNNSSQIYSNYQKQKDSLYIKNGFLVSDTNLYFNFKDFEDTNYFSFEDDNRVYKGTQNLYNVLFEVDGSKLNPDETYKIKFWVFNQGDNCGQDMFNGLAYINQTKGEEKFWLNSIPMQNSFQITENWTMIELTLENIDVNSRYSVVVLGNERSLKPYYFDDLLFYNEKLSLYKENENQLFFNGDKIEL